jgi:phospholipase C
MAALDEIQTIVVLMLENRSFDNVLGHLRHRRYGNRTEIDGIDPASAVAYANFFENQEYQPFGWRDDRKFTHDLPHDRRLIALQLDVVNEQPTMGGFVNSYVEFTQSRVTKPPPMGFLTPLWVPMSGLLAEEYLVCNRWFSPLPTGTQPNRAVAFSGSSLIEDNVIGTIPHEELVFDWLNRNGVRWRVYYHGIPFFLLFGCFDELVGGNFRKIDHLAADVANEPPGEAPQVIFIEPEYEDSPIHLGYDPNDNHPPLPIGPGEGLLRSVYSALTSKPEKWARTLLLVTYDEHGGFFDHVPPPRVRTAPPPGARFANAFETLGVRVPTLVASPWVSRRSVHDGLFDHTSILQLLAEKFAGAPTAYSDSVNDRRAQGILSASALLDLDVPRADVPGAPTGEIRTRPIPHGDARAPANDNQASLAAVAREFAEREPQRAVARFPELAALPPADG